MPLQASPLVITGVKLSQVVEREFGNPSSRIESLSDNLSRRPTLLDGQRALGVERKEVKSASHIQ